MVNGSAMMYAILDLFNCLEHLALEVRHKDFEEQVDDLGSDRKVEHLLRETIRVDVELLGLNTLALFGELASSDLEDIKMWSQNFSEWNVNKGSEK